MKENTCFIEISLKKMTKNKIFFSHKDENMKKNFRWRKIDYIQYNIDKLSK